MACTSRPYPGSWNSVVGARADIAAPAGVGASVGTRRMRDPGQQDRADRRAEDQLVGPVVVQEQHRLLRVESVGVGDQSRELRETVQVVGLELGGAVEAVHGRLVDIEHHVVVAEVPEPGLEARERRRRLPRPARPGDEHPDAAAAHRTGVRRLPRRRRRPPVQDRAEWEARLPPGDGAGGRRPVDGRAPLGVVEVEDLRPAVVHRPDPVVVEPGDLALGAPGVRAPLRRRHRHARRLGVEEADVQRRRCVGGRHLEVAHRRQERRHQRVAGEAQADDVPGDIEVHLATTGAVRRGSERARGPGEEQRRCTRVFARVDGQRRRGQPPPGSRRTGHPVSSTSWMGSIIRRSCMSV